MNTEQSLYIEYIKHPRHIPIGGHFVYKLKPTPPLYLSNKETSPSDFDTIVYVRKTHSFPTQSVSPSNYGDN